jgi:hypothetical protein
VTRLLVLAEGDSEELFVRELLAPHLSCFGIYASATGVLTKRLANGTKYAGGNRWGKVYNSLRPLLGDSDAWVTTLLDYYGLPEGFPGIAETAAASTDTLSQVRKIETSLAEALDHPPRFIPFLAVHEFEAWYFAEPSQVEKFYSQPGIAQRMRQASETAGGPESINQGKETHPSKRLEGYAIGFRKTAGVAVLKEIGIPAIRAACPHFAGWLDRLEALGRDT